METEEELIFGKFKIGDIVVSLTNKNSNRKEGELFKVLDRSSRNALYYKESANSSASKEWRLATKEEKEAYERGIKNIKDIIKPKELIKGKIYKCKGEIGSIFVYDGGNSSPYYIGQHLTEFKKGGGNFSTNPDSCDLANEEEKAWLQACIKADRFITKEEALKKQEEEKQYEYYAVHTKTKEEWKFVLKHSNSTIDVSNFSTYKNVCYVFKHNNKKSDLWGSLEYLENKSKIYSFGEWKKEMGISINVTTSGTFTVGDESIYTSKYTVKMDEFGQMGISSSPWVEYKWNNTHSTTNSGIQHQEPIIKKKINNKKSILVL